MKKRLISLALAALLLLTLTPLGVLADGDMACSDALVDYLKKGEGYRAMPYSDGAGNWLIGYGCVCDPAQYPNGITEPEAEALLRQKLGQFSDAVNAFLRRYGVSVTQGQFDALCALSYNLGSGWLRAGNRLPDMLIAGLTHYSRREIAAPYRYYRIRDGAVTWENA